MAITWIRVYPPRTRHGRKAIKPDYALSSHVAALGMAFTEGSAMPQAYANGAFVGNRGSWNRDNFNGYKVVYIPFENGKPSARRRMSSQVSSMASRLAVVPSAWVSMAPARCSWPMDEGNTVWRVASSDGTVIPQTRGLTLSLRTFKAPQN